MLDYLQILRLHFGKHLSGRQIADSQGCGKSTVNNFLKKFKESKDFSFPLASTVTNEVIYEALYNQRGGMSTTGHTHYREIDCPAIYQALPKKGETLKHLWRKYNAVGPVFTTSGQKQYPYSYRQYCKIFSDWCEERNVTSRIQRYPAQNCELDYAGMALYLKNRLTGEEITKVTIFVATMSPEFLVFCT